MLNMSFALIQNSQKGLDINTCADKHASVQGVNMSECLCKLVSQETIDRIESEMPTAFEMERLGEFLKVFGDASRLKIIYYLSRLELCVADLASLTGMQQPAVSQQLKTLRLSRLVKYRKEGQVVYYTLDDAHVSQLFQIALDHVKES